MNRTSLCLTLLAAAPIALASGAETEIRMVHTDYAHAVVGGHRERAYHILETHMAPGFVSESKNGVMNRSQFLTMIRKVMQGSVPTFAKFYYGPFRVRSNEATVRTRFVVRWQSKGKDGKVHHFQSLDRVTEVWRRHGHNWTMARMKGYAGSYTMDGKPMKQSM